MPTHPLRPVKHAPSCPCIDCRGKRAMKVQANIPEGRRYFLQVLGRVEFEVDEGEYRRVFETLFKGGDGTFIPNLSFNHGIITGTYKDPAKEDGPWTYEEVSKDGDST